MREGSLRNPESFGFLLLPIANFVDKLGRVIGSRARAAESFFDCQDKPDKAREVARALLQDWLYAKHLTESYGGRFIAVLQPVAYLSRTRLDHLTLDPTLGRQYAIVYPLVLDLLEHDPQFAPLRASFLDLRSALDVDDYLYIDWCHLSPDGNALVAAELSAGLADLARRQVARGAAQPG
jgi:hypothetical protein